MILSRNRKEKQMNNLYNQNLDNNFDVLAGALAQTLITKNLAYGNSYDESVDTWGNKVMGMRLEDKYNRIKHLLLQDKMKENDESLLDSLLDNAGYSILAINYMLNHGMVSEDDKKEINDKSKRFYDAVFQKMAQQQPASSK